MRGNEPELLIPNLPKLLVFPIPMRGNELLMLFDEYDCCEPRFRSP